METRQRVHSGTKSRDISKRELAHAELARKAAAEGMVLLKNDHLLPLDESASIALFGGGAAFTVKGGIGSGDVNNRKSSSIYQGCIEAGVNVVSEDWIFDYQKRYEEARNKWKETVLEHAVHVENPFDAYAAHPFTLPQGRSIAAADVNGADAAVYVVSRISGEGKDRSRTEGDYYLSGKEKEDIFYLKTQGLPIVLILNVGAPVELTDLLEDVPNIRAVLDLSLPGQEGGRAAVDVLVGKAVPGGRLTTTWARRYEDYPSAENFSHLNGNLDVEEYKEGIYVGYRHFDSYGRKPLYPFGYGLSYTTFSMQLEQIRAADTGIELVAAVKNTGEHYTGREVVQAYISPPQTDIAKEYRRLVGFAKTGRLRPQETQKVVIMVEQKQLASFSEKINAWVIESGAYGVWIGSHIECLQLCAVISVAGQAVVEQAEPICRGVSFEDPGVSAYAKSREAEWTAEAEKQKLPVIFITPIEEKRKAYTAPTAQGQPVEELIPLLYGNITQGASTLGSAGIRVPGSAGETTEALEEKYGIRSLIMADGPAGLRLRQSYEVDKKTDAVYGAGVLGSLENGFLEETVQHEDADTYYQYCTAFPVGTALAQTWDIELMREFGRAIAAEMKEFYIDLWLAPGMNIHRNPLCGRNFEYYSEDPYLSGMMAAAVTEGVQEDGRCGVTIKHFACNNQEDHRMGVDERVSQQALREIYLRAFEIAVKKSAPAAIMTSYNKINGIYAANSRDLCTVIARNEWGFEGVIMSDWNTTVPKDGSVPWQCAAAGNDIIMPGNGQDDENIRDAYARGELSEEAVRSCAGRILELIRRFSI